MAACWWYLASNADCCRKFALTVAVVNEGRLFTTSVSISLTLPLYDRKPDLGDPAFYINEFPHSEHPLLLNCKVSSTIRGKRTAARSYSDVWNSMFSSTESCAGVPEVLSPERVATARKPLELVWTS